MERMTDLTALTDLLGDLSVPDLVHKGEEVVWDPLSGSWTTVPVYEFVSGQEGQFTRQES